MIKEHSSNLAGHKIPAFSVYSGNIDRDFIDGEEHKITCPCGHQFVAIIERPIE
ncbi:MAG: hypothetical protein Q8O02_00530 [Candidatus Omnitrophota bacterium]|nr:hypothetical protein [Candidatus Omnitrophota bacterium]